jgi:G:T-mismatch repair DNA endonuclease (very short patch repair protein)
VADHLTPEHRSWNMAQIKGKDTRPEVLVRSMLHRAGYRFRKNVKNLPGNLRTSKSVLHFFIPYAILDAHDVYENTL